MPPPPLLYCRARLLLSAAADRRRPSKQAALASLKRNNSRNSCKRLIGSVCVSAFFGCRDKEGRAQSKFAICYLANVRPSLSLSLSFSLALSHQLICTKDSDATLDQQRLDLEHHLPRARLACSLVQGWKFLPLCNNIYSRWFCALFVCESACACRA